MKRKSFVWILILAALFSIMAGCAGGGSDTKESQPTAGKNTGTKETTTTEVGTEKIKLSFWYGWTGPEAEALEKLIAKWNEANPNIQVKGLSQSDYQKQLTAITGGNPPDIASQFGQNVVPWGAKGAMMPLDDYIAKDGVDLKDFVPSALKTSQYEGKTYAIPIAMHVLMLFYNKDLLAEAGFDGPPKTIGELKNYIQKLSVVQKDGRPERLGLWPGMDTYTFTYAYGGKFYDEASKTVTPDDPGVKAAISLSKGIWDQYGSENLDRFSAGLGKYMSAQNPFFTGKYVMSIDGEWLPTFIKQFAPKLNYGIAPIPYDENHPDLKNPGSVSTSVFYIPKGAKHPDASWAFLKWMTEPEQMAEFTAAIGNLPTRTSAFANPVYDNVQGFKEFLEYSKSSNLQSFPATTFANEYMTELSEQYDAILRGKVSLDEGLKKVKDQIQPLVK